MGELITYVVMPIDGMWKVSMSGDSQADSVHADKRAAIARAELLARQYGRGQVVVRTPEGAVEAAYFLPPGR